MALLELLGKPDKAVCGSCGRKESIKSVVSILGAKKVAEKLRRRGVVSHKHENGWLEQIIEVRAVPPIWIFDFFCPSCTGERSGMRRV